MKTLKTLILSILLLCLLQFNKAQTVNWNSLNDSKHIITAGIGWDYGMSYSVGYAYQVKTKIPLIFNTSFSIPSGENIFDDFKTKMGGQFVLLNRSGLKSSIIVNGIYRRYENPLVTLQNFGSEMKGTLGYYKSKWFFAGEIGFDKAIVTHFNHSASFRENIFQDVKDGWYSPTTGGNFHYGFQTGYSFWKSDLTLSLGKVTTEDFKTTPLIPFYLMVGINLKI